MLSSSGGLVAKSCLTLTTPWTVCSPSGSSVHGISQASILEWAAISFSRGSSWHRDQTHVSFIAGQLFTDGTTREASGEAGIFALFLILEEKFSVFHQPGILRSLWIFNLWLLLCWGRVLLYLVCQVFLSWKSVEFCQLLFLHLLNVVYYIGQFLFVEPSLHCKF